MDGATHPIFQRLSRGLAAAALSSVCAVVAAANDAVEANAPSALPVAATPDAWGFWTGILSPVASADVDAGSDPVDEADIAEVMVTPPQEHQALPVPSAAPVQRGAPGPARFDAGWPELVRVGGALGAVIGLIVVLRLVLRRAAPGSSGGRPGGVLEILARYPVARGRTLVLLKLGRRVVLVHETSAGMAPLTEITDPDEVASLLGRLEAGSRPRDARRFATLLRQHEGGAADLRPDGPAQLATEVVDLTRRSRRGARA